MARAYAAKKQPRFYEHLAPELAYSRELFFNHPLISRCAEDVLPFLNDNFGHGIEHSKNVAIEAGAIILAELYKKDPQKGRHLVILAQLAGLLHDICRMETDHALVGADLALQILKDFPLDDLDKEMITFAIRNHEAFKTILTTSDFETDLLSGALYDADKFRWGPDNFVTTLWEICDYNEWPVAKILERFPQGINTVKSIAKTFRTETGKTYGPEFIDLGLDIGNFIYRKMLEFCA